MLGMTDDYMESGLRRQIQEAVVAQRTGGVKLTTSRGRPREQNSLVIDAALLQISQPQTPATSIKKLFQVRNTMRIDSTPAASRQTFLGKVVERLFPHSDCQRQRRIHDCAGGRLPYSDQ